MKPWPAIRCAARALAGALALSPCAARSEPTNYTLDPHHSWVQFELSHFGTSTIRGRLGPAEGRIILDRSAGAGTVDITVPTASVSTGLSVFDWRLRRADLLAAEEHPTAWFIARTLRFEGDRVAEVRGEFTLRGVSHSLTLTAIRFGCFEHPVLERVICGGDFVGRFLRSDYGMDFGLPFVGNGVTLTVQVEAVREAVQPP